MMENISKSSDFDSRADMLASLFRSSVQDTDNTETNPLSLDVIQMAWNQVKGAV